MAISTKLAFAALFAACLPLAGCGPLERVEGFEPLGFVAPRPHLSPRRHAAVVAPPAAAVAQPAAAVPAATALSKCNQSLYVQSTSSQEELRALEDKCREIILSQPY